MNDLIKVRKIVTHVENIFHEGGPVSKIPIKKGAVLIVLENPYAGQYVSKIIPMMEALKPLGLDAANKLIDLLGGADQVQSYGKGSIVGESGSGKTTLGKAILKLLPLTSGEIALDGQDINLIPSREIKEFRIRVQGVFQDPYSSMNAYMNVGQILETHLGWASSGLGRQIGNLLDLFVHD